MYLVEFKKHVKRTLAKIKKKDRLQLETIRGKVKQIAESPYRFKPLRAPLQSLRRVHILKSFVLVYSVDEKTKTVTIEDYDHHDNVYNR